MYHPISKFIFKRSSYQGGTLFKRRCHFDQLFFSYFTWCKFIIIGYFVVELSIFPGKDSFSGIFRDKSTYYVFAYSDSPFRELLSIFTFMWAYFNIHKIFICIELRNNSLLFVFFYFYIQQFHIF